MTFGVGNDVDVAILYGLLVFDTTMGFPAVVHYSLFVECFSRQ